jgi:hypothetical protein
MKEALDFREGGSMGSLMLVALISASQGDTGEQYYKFPKDTSWTYEGATEGSKRKTVLTVATEEAQQVRLVSKSYDNGKNETGLPVSVVWAVEEGFLSWWTEGKNGKRMDAMQLYKLGSKKGDTWKGAPVKAPDVSEVTHLGTLEVKVPAGTFKNVTEVRVKYPSSPDTNEFTMDFYLAPKVGMIKMETKVGGKTASLMELTEFKKAQ